MANFQEGCHLIKKISFLGDSYNIALRRLFSMEAKFKRDPEFKAKYAEFLDEYLKLNHMREPHPFLIKSDVNIQYYFPHNEVFKEDSATTKIK